MNILVLLSLGDRHKNTHQSVGWANNHIVVCPRRPQNKNKQKA